MGRQVHKIVCVIISYRRHTCQNQGNYGSLFLENTKRHNRKNLNVTRDLASYNKSYLDISLHIETCRFLLSLDFPLISINFGMAFLMSIKTTLANDKSQQHDLHHIS